MAWGTLAPCFDAVRKDFEHRNYTTTTLSGIEDKKFPGTEPGRRSEGRGSLGSEHFITLAEHFWQRLCMFRVIARPLRVLQTEYPYHLVCRTNNRSFRFDQRQAARIMFQALTGAMEKYQLRVHHLVFMANDYRPNTLDVER